MDYEIWRLGYDPLTAKKRRTNRKAKAKRKAKIHAARDREICRERKKFKTSHSKLAKKHTLTQSRISQILKDGGLIGIRAPYQKPEKPKPPPPAPKKTKRDKELPSEKALFKRWERHIPFLNDLNESQ